MLSRPKRVRREFSRCGAGGKSKPVQKKKVFQGKHFHSPQTLNFGPELREDGKLRQHGIFPPPDTRWGALGVVGVDGGV